jgi:molecular chaperone GrpE
VSKHHKVKEESLTDESTGAKPDPSAQSDDPPSAEDILTALTSERDQLAAEKAELHDRILRNQAEFQNFRKRADRERAEFAEYASTEAVRALLPILDDFQRGLKVETADKEFSKGMELIYQRLIDSLKRLGLEPIVSAGQPFDPNMHHAVDKKETDEVPEDTVLEEYQSGYNFKGRLLRPAMVRVAIAPASKVENE